MHWILFPTVWHLPRLSQRLWDNRGKCHTVGKRIQCWSNASPDAYTGRQKCATNVLKWLTFKLQAWIIITGKRLKIYGHIQRGVLQALDPLSNRLMMMIMRRLTSIEFSFDPCNIYRDDRRGVGYPADARSVGDSHPLFQTQNPPFPQITPIPPIGLPSRTLDWSTVFVRCRASC